jgi:hypothetical protein
MQMLMDAGANMNTQDGDYGSALQAASLENYDKIIQILMDAGADVNVQSGYFGYAL